MRSRTISAPTPVGVLGILPNSICSACVRAMSTTRTHRFRSRTPRTAARPRAARRGPGIRRTLSVFHAFSATNLRSLHVRNLRSGRSPGFAARRPAKRPEAIQAPFAWRATTARCTATSSRPLPTPPTATARELVSSSAFHFHARYEPYGLTPVRNQLTVSDSSARLIHDIDNSLSAQ